MLLRCSVLLGHLRLNFSSIGMEYEKKGRKTILESCKALQKGLPRNFLPLWMIRAPRCIILHRPPHPLFFNNKPVTIIDTSSSRLEISTSDSRSVVILSPSIQSGLCFTTSFLYAYKSIYISLKAEPKNSKFIVSPVHIMISSKFWTQFNLIIKA